MSDVWELISCLLVIAFDNKRKSIEVMSKYLGKNKNSIPQNIKETMKGLIKDFEKDLEENDETISS